MSALRAMPCTTTWISAPLSNVYSKIEPLRPSPELWFDACDPTCSEPGAELWYRAILPGAVVFLKDWDEERELTYFEADGAVTGRFSQRNGYRLLGVLT